MTGKHKAFINFTRSLLMSDITALFDPSDFVIEIFEDVVVDEPMNPFLPFDKRTQKGTVWFTAPSKKENAGREGGNRRGIFSMIDIIVEGNLPVLLEELCLSDGVKDALLGKGVFCVIF